MLQLEEDRLYQKYGRLSLKKFEDDITAHVDAIFHSFCRFQTENDTEENNALNLGRVRMRDL